MAKGKVGNAVGKTVESLGDYLKEQRVAARLSLRQLSEQAGVSNPYLSQIERGLRKPSAEVLNQIAKALRISAEQLYLRAGIVSPEDGAGIGDSTVELSILSDSGLTERQKQSLLDVYSSFLAMNVAAEVAVSPTAGAARGRRRDHPDPQTTTRRRTDMAKAKFDIKSIEIPAVVARPLYADVGAADYTVEYVRETVADVQKRFAVGAEGRPEERQGLRLRAQGSPRPGHHRGQHPRRRPEQGRQGPPRRRRGPRVRAAGRRQGSRHQAADQVNEGVNTATETYVELAKRGETTIKRLRGELAGVIDEAADSIETASRPSRRCRLPDDQGRQEVAGPQSAAKSTSQAATTAKKAPAKKATRREADRQQEGDHREEGRQHHGHRRQGDRGRTPRSPPASPAEPR